MNEITLNRSDLENQKAVTVAQIDVKREDGTTARFWVNVGLTPSGYTTVELTANRSDSEKTVHVLGTFLDLEARRIAKQTKNP